MYKKSAILILLFGTVSKMLNAQTVSAADTLAKSNKLYAVVTVLAVILVGIFVYLFSLERKIKKLEKEISTNKKQ
jgi:CcmD family protein